jgi:phage terminase large subunit-like protein
MIKHAHDTGAYKYAIDVLEEKFRTGKYIKLAAQRFLDDLKRDDIYFDLESARKVVNFAKLCNHWKGAKAGTPVMLEPQQQFYFQQLFGWRRSDNDLRRFRRSVKFVARKQYKTTEVAVQALYHSLVDEVNGPQVWIGATKKDQAKICLKDVAEISKKSPELKKHFRTFWNKDKPTEIVCHPSSGLISVLGRDSDTEDGLDVSMAIIDEWHAHKDTGVRDILSSAMGNRAQPLESIITTAGFNLQGPCYTKTRKTCIDILEGIKLDDQQLILLYEMDDFEDWEDKDQWICPNPNLPYSTSTKDALDTEFVRAKNEGGTTEVNFKTKHLNIWTNSAEGWIDYASIRACSHGITEEELIGKDCYGGLDLSGGGDLNAFAMFFPNIRDNIHAVKMLFWIPEDKITQRKDDVDYGLWHDQKWVRKFSDDTVEYDVIAQDIMDELENYNVVSIGVDAAYYNTGPAPYLKNWGYFDRIEKIGQTFSNFTGPTSQIETWVLRKELELFNNPVLAWNFSNVTLAMGTTTGQMPSKGKSADKIDGVAAMLDAVTRYLVLNGEPEGTETKIEMWN